MTRSNKQNAPTDGMALEPLLKVADLERILRVDKRTIFRLCMIGQLPLPIRIGGSRRWRKADIDRFVEPADATEQADDRVDRPASK